MDGEEGENQEEDGKMSKIDKDWNIRKEDGYVCDGCNVREPFEHRCHGEGCYCDDPLCMTRQGRMTQEELQGLIEIVNANKRKSLGIP